MFSSSFFSSLYYMRDIIPEENTQLIKKWCVLCSRSEVWRVQAFETELSLFVVWVGGKTRLQKRIRAGRVDTTNVRQGKRMDSNAISLQLTFPLSLVLAASNKLLMLQYWYDKIKFVWLHLEFFYCLKHIVCQK